ncbi:cytochrome P450 CYP82D47-like [Cucumis melo var. makuwa]|uniref:Cytochrome P450 CYP82D47-like n=1 Tax=Cucumis melo var. makuwa TaxID=1194695 RepID=A0A5D3D522_CUCMM|nr:cytochrome P450 CYP82D47-like [Cucumis melo var. makuwa]
MNNCHIKVEQATTNNSDKPCTTLSFSNGFEATNAMFLEFDEDINNTARGSSSVGDNSNESLVLTLGVRAIRSHPWWIDVGREYIGVVKGDLQRFFLVDFNDQAMNRSNQRQTSLLDRSSFTTIAASVSCFYNDNTSSLSNEGAEDAHHNQMLELQSQPTERVFNHSLGTRYVRLF